MNGLLVALDMGVGKQRAASPPCDPADWPLREYSRAVSAGGIDWHVQVLGHGPVALLLHGTGASSHSFAPLARLLAEEMTLVVPDLPGHGFTRAPDPAALSLKGMTSAIIGLLAALGQRPALLVGHSAGAAVALELAGCCADAVPVVSLNGALLPFDGLAGRLFAPLARSLARTGLVPRLVARRARREGVVERIAAGTGSRVPPESLACYRHLVRRPAHVAAALGMMARWNLSGLVDRAAACPGAITLVAGEKDRMVPAADAARVAARLPRARVVRLADCGHLAHEERPDAIAAICRAALLAGDR